MLDIILIYIFLDNTYINFDLDLVYISHWSGIYYFNYCYFVKVKLSIKLYKILSDFRTFGIPINFNETNERLNKFSRIHHVYITGVVAGFTLFPLLEAKECHAKNLKNNLNELCGIVGTAWWPFNIDFFPVKQLYLMYEMYCGYMLVITASGVTFALAECTEHVILRLKHVKFLFIESFQENNPYLRNEKFGKAVAYHNDILG